MGAAGAHGSGRDARAFKFTTVLNTMNSLEMGAAQWLFSLMSSNTARGSERTVFLGVPAVRACGERLHQAGGYAAMKRVEQAVAWHAASMGRPMEETTGHIRELSAAWNNIGGWQDWCALRSCWLCMAQLHSC